MIPYIERPCYQRSAISILLVLIESQWKAKNLTMVLFSNASLSRQLFS